MILINDYFNLQIHVLRWFELSGFSIEGVNQKYLTRQIRIYGIPYL